MRVSKQYWDQRNRGLRRHIIFFYRQPCLITAMSRTVCLMSSDKLHCLNNKFHIVHYPIPMTTLRFNSRCDEAVNLVMPKWFLMTSCSSEKSYPTTPRVASRVASRGMVTSRGAATSQESVTSRESVTSQDSATSRDSTPDLQFHNPSFESRPASADSRRQDPPLLSSPSVVSNTSSIVSVCNVKITEPILSSPPPINKITSSISMKNPFRKDKLDRNHAKAVTSRDSVSSRDKRFETRLEMGELDLKSRVLGTETESRSSRSNRLMKEIV